MSRVRGALWAVAIGVTAVVVATLLFRLLPGGGVVYVALLVLSVAFVSALTGLAVEIPPAAGAGAGVFSAALVAVVLGLTIAAAPLGPGAKRPGFADLLWGPLLALLAALAVCGFAGWFGARTGVRFARRRRDLTKPPA